jgi:hypothetical protein
MGGTAVLQKMTSVIKVKGRGGLFYNLNFYIDNASVRSANHTECYTG